MTDAEIELRQIVTMHDPSCDPGTYAITTYSDGSTLMIDRRDPKVVVYVIGVLSSGAAESRGESYL